MAAAVQTRTLLFATFVALVLLLLTVYLYSDDLSKYSPMKMFDKSKSPTEKPKTGTNLGFIHAFIASISVIVVSEIGDKTFFIAAIMAMRHSRLITYAGAMGALGAMTILSALLGNIVTQFVPRIYTYYLSSILFACFGVKMLKDGYAMSANEGADEYEEVEHEVEKAEAVDDLESGENNTSSTTTAAATTTTTTNNAIRGSRSVQTKGSQKSGIPRIISIIRRYISPIFIQAFIMTFLAEWGDRSQITTIVLAASENLLGVIIGGTIGHALCTGLAVIGGRFIAQRISPKTVTLIGGVVFLLFAVSAFFIRPDS